MSCNAVSLPLMSISREKEVKKQQKMADSEAKEKEAQETAAKIAKVSIKIHQLFSLVSTYRFYVYNFQHSIRLKAYPRRRNKSASPISCLELTKPSRKNQKRR